MNFGELINNYNLNVQHFSKQSKNTIKKIKIGQKPCQLNLIKLV